MQETFSVTELVEIFRESLLALLPSMDKAKIAWRGPSVYDPWEDVERTLFGSIIGSCVSNAIVLPRSGVRFAPYGLPLKDWCGFCFLSSPTLRTGDTMYAFTEIAHSGPRNTFDEARFTELGPKLSPTGKAVGALLDQIEFDLVIPGKDGPNYFEQITFEQ